jgi:hypothetical protein
MTGHEKGPSSGPFLCQTNGKTNLRVAAVS